MYPTQVLAEAGSGKREDRATRVSNTLGCFRIHPRSVMPPTATTYRSAAGEQRRLDVTVLLNEVLPIGRPLRRSAVFALCAYEVHVPRHLDVAVDADVIVRHVLLQYLAQRDIDAPRVAHGVMETRVHQERVSPIDEDRSACQRPL